MLSQAFQRHTVSTYEKYGQRFSTPVVHRTARRRATLQYRAVLLSRRAALSQLAQLAHVFSYSL